MENRICERCGEGYIALSDKRGPLCRSCQSKKSIERDGLPLLERYTTNKGHNAEIDSAIVLLTKLGYDLDRDIHEQWLERWRHRGVTF